MTKTWSELVDAQFSSDGAVVVDDERTVTYAEMAGLAGAAADWLDAADAEPGAPVPALFNTSATSLALTIAGASTGRPLAPLGPRLTVKEISACVIGLESSLLMVEPAFAELGRDVAAASGVRCVVVDRLEGTGRRLSPEGQPDAVAAILHTSGTTGAPKRVHLRQDRLANRVRVSSALMGIDNLCVYASGSPFYHIAGLGNLAVMLAMGAANLPFPRFDLEAWKQLGEGGVTHAFLVPTMIERLLEAGALFLPSLRLLQYGSSAIRATTLAQAVQTLPGVRFINMFGQTEGSPIACLTPDDHVRAMAGRPDILASVGRAAPGIELRLLESEPGTAHEVLARGDHLFKESEDGWLHTGDLGQIDDEGYLYLVGRLNDRIKRGGENVLPVEVEDVLIEHPAVREVAVVGVPDPVLGQVVKAFIVLDPSVPVPSPEDLRQHARAVLSGYKVPTQWEFVGDLPRNAGGKVLRRLLAAPTTQPAS
jgi:acyl-CoA synthetase (AMP-forming)/AMP-acid ligase II